MPAWLVAFTAVISAIQVLTPEIEAILKEIHTNNTAPSNVHLAALNTFMDVHSSLLGAATSLLPKV